MNQRATTSVSSGKTSTAKWPSQSGASDHEDSAGKPTRTCPLFMPGGHHSTASASTQLWYWTPESDSRNEIDEIDERACGCLQDRPDGEAECERDERQVRGDGLTYRVENITGLQPLHE
jgi:hypothetical protein